jgi:hypothetical protein
VGGLKAAGGERRRAHVQGGLPDPVPRVDVDAVLLHEERDHLVVVVARGDRESGLRRRRHGDQRSLTRTTCAARAPRGTRRQESANKRVELRLRR